MAPSPRILAIYTPADVPYYTVEVRGKHGWGDAGLKFGDVQEAHERAKTEIMSGFVSEARVVGWNISED